MSRTDLISTFEQAKQAEVSENFFNASAFYKEALELSIKVKDSKLIRLCKNKIVEMNKKSIDSGKDFKEVEISVDFSEDEQKAINKNIEKITGQDNINTTLEIIGVIPWFCPDIKEIEKQALSSTPIFYQFANLQTVSDSGHSLRGGSDPKYSWFMDTYRRTQKFIMDIYLNHIFYLLIRNKKLTLKNLFKYFSDSGLLNTDRLKIVNVGLEKYFEKDYVSALHILVPQFESFILDVAKKLGINIVALDTKLDVATRTMILSEAHLDSADFKRIFGENFCRQVKFILFEPLGYKIRHKIAHGEISFNECNFQNTTLILYLYLVLLARIKPKKT
jgi:hypothetical protein